MTILDIKEKENSLITDDAHELICYATINEINLWKDVVNLYSEIKQNNFPKKVLLLLEDIGQCEYTSMHASMGEGLYFDTSELVEDDSEASWDNTRPLELQHHIEQLLKPENYIDFNDLSKKLNYSDEDQATLLQINAEPEKILDDVIQVKLISSKTETQKFAACLNGYFSCDLNPFESFILIEHLNQNYGLEYIGLGASLFFFIKTSKFDENKTPQLLNELSKFYQFNQTTHNQLEQHLSNHEYLILPYVESLEVFDLD
ncbi:hypothetical protein DBL02_04920 [Acinetobacter oleivorans]|uniref:hypothetical protein n=1 Tax=Acinetobacter oleivorans TaxID=1148157 RepID=UPI000D326E19|nr:hypothetical protein [Acinetobacter oleivorans]PTV47661.1 hypothetical protein DBL02_04920 [Acinetobacter oleivorans]